MAPMLDICPRGHNKVVYYDIYHLFILVVYHAITVLSGNLNARVIYNNQIPSKSLAY